MVATEDKFIQDMFADSIYFWYKRVLKKRMKNKDVKKLNKMIKSNKSIYDIFYFINLFNEKNISNKIRKIHNTCYLRGKDDLIYFIEDKNEPLLKFAHYEDLCINFKDTKRLGKAINIGYINGCFEYLYYDPILEKYLTKTLVPMNFNINKSYNNGKDLIKSYFFKPEFGYLYYVKLKIGDIITHKIGITNSNTNKRYKSENIEILEYKQVRMLMLEAATIERAYHKTLQEYRHYIDVKFGGVNECYKGSISSIEYIDINMAMDILDIDNLLNLPNGSFKKVLDYQRKIKD